METDVNVRTDQGEDRQEAAVPRLELGKDSVDGIATLSDHKIPVKYDVKGKGFAERIRADA